MKKLLALVLVLGVASMASAALSWDWTGNTLSLDSEASDEVSTLNLALIQGDGTFSSGQMFGFDGSMNNGSAGDGSGYPNAWIIADAQMQTGNGHPGGTMFSVDYAGTATPTIEDLTAYGYTSYYDTLNSGTGLDIPAVPEPITMSLLGLGGLVALRRRRA